MITRQFLDSKKLARNCIAAAVSLTLTLGYVAVLTFATSFSEHASAAGIAVTAPGRRDNPVRLPEKIVAGSVLISARRLTLQQMTARELLSDFMRYSRPII